MNIIFCGDRNWNDREQIRRVMTLLELNLRDLVIIQGEARGADRIAKQIAYEQKLICNPFCADWEKYGKAAGPIRNTEMLIKGNAHGVVAFHNDIQNSRGTKDMIQQARVKKIPAWLNTDGDEKLAKFIIDVKRVAYGESSGFFSKSKY